VPQLLHQRVAVVTGAAAGLGRGSALSLAAAGASVVLNDIDPVGLETTLSLIEKDGGRAIVVTGDVSVTAHVTRMMQAAVEAYGGIDIVHANAGIGQYQVLEEISEQDMDRLLAVNLKGALLCAQHSLPHLRKRGGGSLIFTSSVQATHSLPGCVVYAATKAGLIAAARTLALEVGKYNIRVNTISPGTIDTPMFQRDLADMNIEEVEAFRARVDRANALGRVGLAKEIGDAVVYLASGLSSYVTASDLVVDGGFKAVKSFS
jgi:NAD(P)-dependent dehydrogenase (short-subunit alcohol dehydrogenase family)